MTFTPRVCREAKEYERQGPRLGGSDPGYRDVAQINCLGRSHIPKRTAGVIRPEIEVDVQRTKVLVEQVGTFDATRLDAWHGTSPLKSGGICLIKTN